MNVLLCKLGGINISAVRFPTSSITPDKFVFLGDDLDSSCWNTKLESELILKVCVCITCLSLIHLEQKIRPKFLSVSL